MDGRNQVLGRQCIQFARTRSSTTDEDRRPHSIGRTQYYSAAGTSFTVGGVSHENAGNSGYLRGHRHAGAARGNGGSGSSDDPAALLVRSTFLPVANRAGLRVIRLRSRGPFSFSSTLFTQGDPTERADHADEGATLDAGVSLRCTLFVAARAADHTVVFFAQGYFLQHI